MEWHRTLSFGPWEAVSESDHGLVPLSRNIEPIFQVVEWTSEEVKAWALKLYQISYDCRNWSWLLNLNRLVKPPIISRPSAMVRDDMAPLSNTNKEEVST